MKQEGENVVSISQFFVKGNECTTGCYIFFGVWAILCAICLLYQYEVCQGKGIAKFSNIEDEEGVSDAPSDEEVEENLLV